MQKIVAEGEKKKVGSRDFHRYSLGFVALNLNNIIMCKLITVIKSNVSEPQAIVWSTVTVSCLYTKLAVMALYLQTQITLTIRKNKLSRVTHTKICYFVSFMSI